jgi:methylmalonyl-CoA decarboxylase
VPLAVSRRADAKENDFVVAEEEKALVRCEVANQVAWITLDSPPVNALSIHLIDDLAEALHAAQPPQVRAVVIRAKPGSTVFSAGHDVHELPVNGRDPLTYNDPLRKVIRQIEAHPCPVVAMVEGSVWGGACEVVFSCDLVASSVESSFALTPSRLGVPYNMSGILNILKVADMHLVKEMLFTARSVSAAHLGRSGVINAVVPTDELADTVAAMTASIVATSPLVNRILKEELRVLSNAHPLTPEAYERIQALRREAYDSDDYQEGIQAFKEKRPPVFRGS